MYENEFPESAAPRIVAGAIMSDDYLAFLCNVYTIECTPNSTEAQVILKWCIEYYKAHHRAPKKDIELIYIEEEATFSDKTQWELLGYALEAADSAFSNEDGVTDVEFLKEMTLRMFNKNRLEEAVSNAQALSENGFAQKAEEVLKMYSPIIDPNKIDNVRKFNPLDEERHKRLMAFKKDRSIFKLPGALGDRLNSQLVEKGLIGILAPEKRGKTWFLMELAYQATRNNNRCNVLFLQAGDMTNDELDERYSTRLSFRPILATRKPYYKPVLDCKHNQEGTCPCVDNCTGSNEQLITKANKCDELYVEDTTKSKSRRRNNSEDKEENSPIVDPKTIVASNADHIPCIYCKKSSKLRNNYIPVPFWEKKEYKTDISVKELDERMEKYNKGHKGNLFFEEYSNGSLNLDYIQTRIHYHNENGENIRLVCIDYADILLMPNAKEQDRSRQNSLWMGLRRIAQEEKVLLVVPTQADTASYKAHTLDMSNFSEDKRKFGHVTSMWGLNQTANEKRCGILRVNEIVVRGSAFDMTNPVTLLQCLEEGNPLVASYV